MKENGKMLLDSVFLTKNNTTPFLLKSHCISKALGDSFSNPIYYAIVIFARRNHSYLQMDHFNPKADFWTGRHKYFGRVILVFNSGATLGTAFVGCSGNLQTRISTKIHQTLNGWKKFDFECISSSSTFIIPSLGLCCKWSSQIKIFLDVTLTTMNVLMKEHISVHYIQSELIQKLRRWYTINFQLKKLYFQVYYVKNKRVIIIN